MTPAMESRVAAVSVRPPVVEIVRPPAPKPTSPRWAAVVLVGLCVAAGVGVRTYAYARNPSLWIDESMLALNVVHRSPTELFRPLDLNQGAPVGFLLASKVVVSWLGSSEYALRLIPFLAALAGMLVFTLFAYRALPLAAARYAVALFALSPYLAGYAAEFKQYELDATITVGLLAIGRGIWNGPTSRGRLAAMAAAGAAAVWFAHPAVFILGGVGLAVLGDALARGDRRGLVGRMLVVGTWVASFGACYLFVLRNLGTNDYLLDYWAGKFLPLPPTSPGDLAWIVNHYFEMFIKPGGLNGGEFGLAGLAGLCFLVGCFGLFRDDWRLLVAIVVPLLLCLFASGLQKYPFAGRLLLFAVPLLIVGVAHGLMTLAEQLGRWHRGAGAVAVAVLFVGPAYETYVLVKKPLHAEDVREVMARAAADWRDGDRMYVYYGAVPTYCYYHPRHAFPADAVTFGVENRGGDPRRFRDELQAFRGNRRVWVLLAHRQPTDEAAIQAYLDGMGAGDVVMRKTDAVLMRYDLK